MKYGQTHGSHKFYQIVFVMSGDGCVLFFLYAVINPDLPGSEHKDRRLYLCDVVTKCNTTSLDLRTQYIITKSFFSFFSCVDAGGVS